MPRRIEIELTSRTGDGALTWRAAGAKQPRGTVAAELLPEGVSVGDVVRAEIETGLDGVEIVAVLPRQEKPDSAPSDRIEVLGTSRRGPDVLVSYASGRPRRDGGRPGKADAERGGRRDANLGRGPRARRDALNAPGERRTTRGGRERTDGAGAHSDEEPRHVRPRAEARRAHAERPGRTEGVHDGAARRGSERAGTGERRATRGERRDSPGVRRDRRPAISTAHRNAMLAALGPQELPIAEQLLRGGLPAVRQALAEQHAAHPEDPAFLANRDAVLAVAEHLLPRVNLASWKDRASSAQAAGKELRLRELRAVVAAARTVTLDDEARALARALQESLDQRVRALRDEWVGRMTKALADGRVAEAARVSARAPEPAMQLPAELAVRIAEAASETMTADVAPAEWISLLDVVVESPVRRTVKPRGIPDDERAKDAARHAAGLVPELAKLLGLRIPPPPPRRPARSGPGVMAAGGAGRASGR
jgi:hypothetical protein